MTPKLVAHDRSKDAEDAFETALDFTVLGGARLQVVSVATPSEPPTREWLFGSTSRGVVSHVSCSVLVMRQK